MDAILLALNLKFGLDDAVSTILTVIHHIDKAGRRVLEHVEVVAEQIGLHQRCLLYTSICRALDCQPGDVLEYISDDEADSLFGLKDE